MPAPATVFALPVPESVPGSGNHCEAVCVGPCRKFALTDLICTAAAWPRHDPDDERPRVSQCCFASMPTHLTGPDVQPRADTRR
ncbi:hypothetical protein G6O67_008539 [Ophiocordyceps sinensis]|uniref:Uncharacterized protein n=1 Tax=Ophiocordyceps sinensis TaxID=72228 RepID=A0A8H4PJ69_9HYPO|nr:hypothetical protein G6O67_008539 [Ophiocordyceps sinensis]